MGALKARIELVDTENGEFSMKIHYEGGAGFNADSPSHLMAERFHGWLATQAEPKTPAMHVRTDGTMVFDAGPPPPMEALAWAALASRPTLAAGPRLEDSEG